MAWSIEKAFSRDAAPFLLSSELVDVSVVDAGVLPLVCVAPAPGTLDIFLSMLSR